MSWSSHSSFIITLDDTPVLLDKGMEFREVFRKKKKAETGLGTLSSAQLDVGKHHSPGWSEARKHKNIDFMHVP
jgi:hypothetical protein